MINKRRYRERIERERERLEISSRKLDTKGTFHAKMGTIKDRNDMDLTEAEDIKRGDKNSITSTSFLHSDAS